MTYKLAESIKEEKGKVYFAKERLQDIAWGFDGEMAEDYEDVDETEFAKVIYDNITDTSRWSTHHEQVFRIGDRYFMTHYSKASTEIQDEAPYEYDGDWVEVTEVVPKEITVTKYVPKGSR